MEGFVVGNGNGLHAGGPSEWPLHPGRDSFNNNNNSMKSRSPMRILLLSCLSKLHDRFELSRSTGWPAFGPQSRHTCSRCLFSFLFSSGYETSLSWGEGGEGAANQPARTLLHACQSTKMRYAGVPMARYMSAAKEKEKEKGEKKGGGPDHVINAFLCHFCPGMGRPHFLARTRVGSAAIKEDNNILGVHDMGCIPSSAHLTT